MIVIAYLLTILIGVVLGLLGGGGSILTVPILVYIFGINSILSTAYSLFIVGITSLFLVIFSLKKNLINFKIGISFGIPSIIGVYISRKYILSLIPDTILSIGNYSLSKNISILLLFSIMMIIASISMIKNHNTKLVKKNISEFRKNLIIPIQGLLIGLLTGIIGAGGGFIIIPVLVLISGLEIKEAIGTSLFIITISSLIGFLGDIQNQVIDWYFLIKISIFTVFGSFIGNYFMKKVSSEKLKPAFGYFVMIMGIFIFLKEILFNFK